MSHVGAESWKTRGCGEESGELSTMQLQSGDYPVVVVKLHLYTNAVKAMIGGTGMTQQLKISDQQSPCVQRNGGSMGIE